MLELRKSIYTLKPFRKKFWIRIFCILRSVIFLLSFFLKIFFRFSLFLGHLQRCGRIVPTQKLNRVKTDSPFYIRKNDGFYVLNTKYVLSVFNTKCGSTRTKYGVFSLKYESPYIHLNRLEKNFGSVVFAFRALLFYLYLFQNFFRFSVFFRAITAVRAHYNHN